MAKQRFGVNDAYRGTVGTVIGYEWRGKWCLRARPLHVRNPRTAKQQSNRQLFKQMVDLASHMKFALRKGLRGVSLGMHVTECNLFVKRNKECFSLDAEGRMVVDWERLIVSEGEVAAPGFTGTVLMDTRLMDTALMDTPLSQPQAAASSPNLGEQLNGKSGEQFMDTPLSQPQAAASSPNLGEQLDGKGRGKQSILGEQLNGKQTILGEHLDGMGRGRKHLGSSPKLGEGDRRGAVAEGCVEIPFEWDGGSGDNEVYVYAYCPEMEEGVLSASTWRRSGSVQLTLLERWQGKEIHFYGFAVDEKGAASDTVYIGAMEMAKKIETRQAASLQGWTSDATFAEGTRRREDTGRLSPSLSYSNTLFQRDPSLPVP